MIFRGRDFDETCVGGKVLRPSTEVIGVQPEVTPLRATGRTVAARAGRTPSQRTRTLASGPAGILQEPIFSV